MKLNLWNAPFNGGWVWFERKNLRRFEAGWDRPQLWWALCGFCGHITLQTWPGMRDWFLATAGTILAIGRDHGDRNGAAMKRGWKEFVLWFSDIIVMGGFSIGINYRSDDELRAYLDFNKALRKEMER